MWDSPQRLDYDKSKSLEEGYGNERHTIFLGKVRMRLGVEFGNDNLLLIFEYVGHLFCLID